MREGKQETSAGLGRARTGKGGGDEIQPSVYLRGSMRLRLEKLRKVSRMLDPLCVFMEEGGGGGAWEEAGVRACNPREGEKARNQEKTGTMASKNWILKQSTPVG